MRAMSTYSIGLRPVLARKRRAKWKRLMQAALARSARLKLSPRCAVMYACTRARARGLRPLGDVAVMGEVPTNSRSP